MSKFRYINKPDSQGMIAALEARNARSGWHALVHHDDVFLA
ncbi:hypothetical protein BQ8482_440026 [Mesorhizobium delmotii]|uniref:Uncharacterized protein n=1 Tax=Mesorhizobium delmotii TaxID=1631247 RepID=A0A2P9ATI8_9HYPH|nr:hypothetical protein BQ8482_440026 [Mesorhizobium delmotii]